MKFITLKTKANGESEIIVGPEKPGAIHRKTVIDARGTVKTGERVACFSLTPVSAASGPAPSTDGEPETPKKKAKE
jgi:hypothetical protein